MLHYLPHREGERPREPKGLSQSSLAGKLALSRLGFNTASDFGSYNLLIPLRTPSHSMNVNLVDSMKRMITHLFILTSTTVAVPHQRVLGRYLLSGLARVLQLPDQGPWPRTQYRWPSTNLPLGLCSWVCPPAIGLALIFVCACPAEATSAAFEGHIRAIGGRSGATTDLLYTVGTNHLRVEMTDTNFPNPVDVLDLRSGQVTLMFPINRTFVRFKPGSPNSSGPRPGLPGGFGTLPPGIGPRGQPSIPPNAPQMPVAARPLPPGIGPTNPPGMPARPMPSAALPPGVGPQAQAPTAPGAPAMPSLPGPSANPGTGSTPPMPMIPPTGGLELQASGARTNLLNFDCQRYEIRQFGQRMEIWATDQLVPFQAYLPHQPPGFGRPMIEDQWPDLLSAKMLFPLRAILTADNGVERYRFEVQSITPVHLTKEEAQGFQPPEGYVQIQARPF
jgi:hypothetical protein